ncbi:uncharacterized protein LOC144359956 [Saccoglossus kowalevskii]
MRKDRGWFCLPESRLKASFTPTCKLIMRYKIPAGSKFSDMVIFSRKYNAEELLHTGVVCGISNDADLLDLAKAVIQRCLGKKCFDRDSLKVMKSDMYSDAVSCLTTFHTPESTSSKL